MVRRDANSPLAARPPGVRASHVRETGRLHALHLPTLDATFPLAAVALRERQGHSKPCWEGDP